MLWFLISFASRPIFSSVGDLKGDDSVLGGAGDLVNSGKWRPKWVLSHCTCRNDGGDF